MRPLLVTVTLLFVTAVFSGCVTQDGDDDKETETTTDIPAAWPAHALALEGPHAGDDHDHRDPAHHRNVSTPNFRQIGWDPLETDHHGKTSGSYICGDVSESADRRLGVVHSHLSDVAIVVVDLTDPTAPVKVGELVLPNTFIYDVAITPDSEYAVLATSDASSQDERPFRTDTPTDGSVDARYRDRFDGRPYFIDACTGAANPVAMAAQALMQGPLDAAPFSAGLVLVGLDDPAALEVLDFTPTPVPGAHSVFATQVGGTYHVLGSIVNLQHESSYFQFVTIEPLPTGPKLVSQSTYRPAPSTEGEKAYINGHVDGWIQEHPGTGDVLAYLADWDGGLVIVDLNDPTMPKELGRWTNYKGQEATEIYNDDSGSIHSARPLDMLWDDRHYTIIGQEVVGRPTDTPTGVTYIMDTTDPTDPQPVSAWTLPVDPTWDEGILQYSTHYVDLFQEARILFVTMYHGGVWAVDLANVTSPQSVGVFLPAEAPPNPPGDLYYQYDWAPTVLEAETIDEDTLVVWDGGSGVYTVDYLHDVTVPDVEEWDVALD